MRHVLPVLLVVVGLLASAQPAGANFLASGTDPAGNATTGEAQRDLTDVSFAYDRRTGAMEAGFRLAAEPRPQRSFVTIAAGQKTATGCNGYPAITFAAYTDEFDGSWARLDQPGVAPAARGDADKRGVSAQVQTFQAEDRALAGGTYDCVLATLSEPGNPANVYDAIQTDLVGYPSLLLRIPDGVQRIKLGAKRSIKVTMTNTGDAPATGLGLRVKRAKGITVKPARRSLGTLAPGAKRTVKLTVGVGRRARPSSDLTVTGRTGKLAVEGGIRVRRVDPRGGGGGGGGGGRPPIPSTCTRYAPDPFGDTGGSLVLVPCTV